MKTDRVRAHCSPRELTNSKVRDSIIKLVSVFKSKRKGGAVSKYCSFVYYLSPFSDQDEE